MSEVMTSGAAARMPSLIARHWSPPEIAAARYSTAVGSFTSRRAVA